MPIEGLVLKMFLMLEILGSFMMQVGYTAADEGGGGATCRGPTGTSRDQDPIYFNVTCTPDCPSFTNAPTTCSKARSNTNMKLLALNFFHTDTYGNEIKHQKHLSTKNNCDSNPLTRLPVGV